MIEGGVAPNVVFFVAGVKGGLERPLGVVGESGDLAPRLLFHLGEGG